MRVVRIGHLTGHTLNRFSSDADRFSLGAAILEGASLAIPVQVQGRTHDSQLNLIFRLLFAYAVPMAFGLQGGTAHKSNDNQKGGNTIVIAAAFIAAVKLAREDNLCSPRAAAKINDSIQLAHKIYWRVRQLYPTLF
jgi:hypothetical protein